VPFILAQEGVLIDIGALDLRGIERASQLFLLFLLLELLVDLVLGIVQIARFVVELLENASIVLQDLVVDPLILSRDLGVQNSVLNFYFRGMRHSEGCNFVRQVTQRCKVASAESHLHFILLLICILVKHCESMN
jgi:hypothetical protein